MIFRTIFKMFMLFFVSFLVMLSAFAETKVNSLAQIHIDKPFDNSYQLSLLFKDDFSGNAFLQKRKNGSFYVYIPDTVITSKNIKMVYKGNVSQSDVKINIEEQPYIKENSKSKYIRLSVDTPVNSDIQLTSKKFIQTDTKSNDSFTNLYSIIVAALLAIIVLLSVSIYRTLRKMNSNTGKYTAFPSGLLNSPQEYVKRNTEPKHYTRSKNLKINRKNLISPVSTEEFKCFNLPLRKGEMSVPISSAIHKTSETNSITNKTANSKITNPLSNKKKILQSSVTTLDIPMAEDLIDSDKTPIQNIKTEEIKIDDNYRPELISELKIGTNKGFYLTTVGDNSFALFGYIGDKVFFLQKFNDLTQINLQARFYANKNGRDLYVVRLDSYKAMLMVSDTEIKELAVI